jgi:hypothetical protein
MQEPLEGKFNGAGKVAFDRFEQHGDAITADLNFGRCVDYRRAAEHEHLVCGQ